MAGQRRRGYKAPKNYEPGRKPAKRGRFSAPRGAEGSTADRSEPAGLKAGRKQAGRPKAERSKAERSVSADAKSAPRREAPRDRPKRRAVEAPRARLRDAIVTTPEQAARLEFGDLGLGGNLVRTLAELGADRPFAIQAATIPDIVDGRDVLGKARTGSGKTIAFGAGVVERLLRLKAEGAFAGKQTPDERPKRGVRSTRGKARNPRALILAPTRELALQIDRTVQPLARSVGFYTAQLVGGVPLDPQVHALERGVDIVIGTPGRIRDLVNRRRLDLREVLVSVIDEADQMCDLGFLEATQEVLRQTVRGGQRLLFSATLDGDVDELVSEFLGDPAVHESAERAEDLARHRVFLVLREDKDEAVRRLLGGRGRIIAFCRTRAAVDRVTEMLVEDGVRAVPLHGDLKQAVRERNLERFATGRAGVLVATDVAARGIHIDGVDLVVQVDPPDDAKAYLHRAGRTGRAGASGEVITLIPRTRQKRTRELFEDIGIAPDYFGDYDPAAPMMRKR